MPEQATSFREDMQAAQIELQKLVISYREIDAQRTNILTAINAAQGVIQFLAKKIEQKQPDAAPEAAA